MPSALLIADVKSVISDFAAAWDARFGDVSKDAVELADVAQVLADFGVPDAALAADLFRVIAVLVPLVRAGKAAPRGGPPIAEADWSHGPPAIPLPWEAPLPEPDNPSGAIGGT